MKLTRSPRYQESITVRVDTETAEKLEQRLNNPVNAHDHSASSIVREALRRYLRNG